MKIKNVENKVKEVLTENQEARDNDMLLISLVWAKEINPFNFNNMIVSDFLSLMARYKISHATSIIRSRQKLQELYSEYRGDNYNKRHYKHEPEVRKEINQWQAEEIQTSFFKEENNG